MRRFCPALTALCRLALALLVAGAALAILPGATASGPEEVVRRSLSSTAKAIKARLDERPEDDRAVSIAPFVYSRDRHANGELLARLLGDELRKLGVVIKDRAPVGVRGTFQLETDKDTRRAMVKVKITLDGIEGARPLEVDFLEPEVVTLLSAAPVVVDNKKGLPNATNLARRKSHLDKNLIRASKEGKYAVEVLAVDSPTDKTKNGDYAAIKPRLDDGRAFVDIRQGQAYAVRLINDTDQEAAVALSIDGLNSFRFLKVDGKPVEGPSHILLRAKSSVVVYGWQTEPKEVSRFVVTERDKGAWVGHGSVGDVGRIVAQFHACWSGDDGPPKDEPPALAKARSAQGLSTGMGDKIKSPIKTVNKTIGQLRESVPVLYSRRSK